MKKVLVTGATGFIGSHTLPLLKERGFAVAADRVNLLESGAAERWIESLKPSYLLHLAWCSKPPNYLTSEDNLKCVQASLSLIEAFARCGGKRIVVAGTCAEYDARAEVCVENETLLAQGTLYGASKHALRVVARKFCEDRGIGLAWGRIFYAFGPHEHPDRLIPRAIRSLLKGKQFHCNAGTERRDYIYVEDVASAFAALLESDVEGPVNIASGKGTPVGSLVDTIARKTGQPSLVTFGPQSEVLPTIIGDNRRLAFEVGWSPRWDVEAGLDKTIAWWRAQ